jgi:hypothetical protein
VKNRIEILHRSINPANEGFLEILTDQAEELMKGLDHGNSMIDGVACVFWKTWRDEKPLPRK